MMDKRKLLQNITQQVIQTAMMEYSGVEAPKKVIHYDEYDELSRRQIDQGVLALSFQLNLTGASMVDVDLYRLVRTYLWNKEARSAMNEIVDELRLN